MTLGGFNSVKTQTTIYCGALIDTKIPTYHSVAFFVISRKGGCNFLFFLLNFGQLNDSRAADRFSSTSAGQRDVLKEIEARLCGSVSAPVRPRHFVCAGCKPKANYMLARH